MRTEVPSTLTAPVVSRTNGQSAHEARIVLSVLVVEGVSLCRVLGTKTSGAERAGDCHIHRKALPPTPNTDRDVPWPTTRGGPKNVLLLKRVSEHGLLTKPANQVAHGCASR